jgi:hypothetical protein
LPSKTYPKLIKTDFRQSSLSRINQEEIVPSGKNMLESWLSARLSHLPRLALVGAYLTMLVRGGRKTCQSPPKGGKIWI